MGVLLFIPIVLCGALGAAVGYVFRYCVQLRRIAIVATSIVIFLLLEIISGTLSMKNSLGENLTSQVSLIMPFLFLYLLPAIFGAFFVARHFRTWSQ